MRSLSAHCYGVQCGQPLMDTVGLDLMLWSPFPIGPTAPVSLSLSLSLYFSLFSNYTHFPLTCVLGFFHVGHIGISCPVVVGWWLVWVGVGPHLHLHLHLYLQNWLTSLSRFAASTIITHSLSKHNITFASI